MTDSFLTISGFRKTFGSIVAVEDVSLNIPKGEFLTFLGPSGSGKSTTLYAVAGFDDPSAGDISIDGRSILATPPHKRNIGMVFQRYTLFPHLPVGENIAFPLRVRGHSAADIAKTVKAMLSLVRLEGFEDRLPAQLSGGQQQRVALARALAYDPPVLLMDEPLSALDKKLREEIQVEIRRIHQETGVTILYVTHDQEEALRLSDRIAVFNHGRIEQVGSGEDLYARPATRFVAGFIGDSNFLKVREVERRGSAASAILPDGTRIENIPAHAGNGHAATPELMVRPQSLKFVQGSGAGLAVKVKDVTFLGDTSSVLLETGWGQEIWLRGAGSAVKTNALSGPLHVEWNPADSHLFC
ncbi:ABC transporter ATP-binding protein [Taklimakanibacter lacteus]|uniref:ABC transporter ATP-binding protein n=1 Tax=Taklimakanibacter lacteus TaxID=2268456 RepID=UPI000E672ED2